jgi:tetratricopeptide (TPR) repeat protein
LRAQKVCKFILAVTVIIALNLSCANKVSTRGQEASPAKPPPAGTLGSEGSKQEQRAHRWEAQRLRQAGDTAGAIEELKKVIEAGDEDKETYLELATFLIYLERYEEAETYLRKLIKKDPREARAHWFLAGILVLNLGRYEEGLKEAKLSKELYGEDDLSYVRDQLIGKAYDGLGDYPNALRHYKAFLKGRSYAPDATDYKEVKKRVSELEKIVRHS